MHLELGDKKENNSTADKSKINVRDFPGGVELRLHAPNAGDLGSSPGQGTRSHVLQLGVHMLQLKTP